MCHHRQRVFSWLADQQGLSAVCEKGSAGCVGERFRVSPSFFYSVAWLQYVYILTLNLWFVGAQANNCILNLTNSAAALRLHVVACCTLNLFFSCIRCNGCLQGTQSRV